MHILNVVVDKAVIEGIVKQAIIDRPKTKHNDVLLIDVLRKSSLSPDVMMADAITVFVAAFHTTGFLMTWVLYFLALHQDVQEKCYDELHDLLGDEPLTAMAINQLPYVASGNQLPHFDIYKEKGVSVCMHN